MVNTAAQAARLVQRIKYPAPNGIQGQRGSAFSSRAAGYGAFGGPTHTARSNASIVLVVMIETPEAVSNAAAIAAVPGVDAVFVGPNDLAHAMGFENRWNEPEVQAAIEFSLKAVAAQGKCPGILALTAQDESKYAVWGARYFANVSTGLITKALRDAAQSQNACIEY
jgi:4-hydroxy-2-oxoheptanedioate aldolase